MIEYPPDFPPRARAAVERTFAEAELDADGALSFVLEVFEVFVWELTELMMRQPDRRTGEQLRSQTEAFLDRVIERAYVRYPTNLRTARTSLLPGDITYINARQASKGLNGLKAAIHQELPKYSFWTNLQQNFVILANAALATSNVFRRGPDGRWEIRYEGEGKVDLPHLEGFELIRRLLESPHDYIDATDLKGIDPADVSEGAPVLDEEARRNYKKRLEEIGKERRARDARQSELNEEAEAIGAELQKSTGLRRMRRLGDDVEKARKAAWSTYQTALKKLAQELPVLYQHLSTTIESGRSFRYQPGADVRWETHTPTRAATLPRPPS